MVFKVSLALALLVYLIQSFTGVAFETNLQRSLFYFIVFYALVSAYQIIYLHIKLRMIHLEQQKRQEKRKQEQKKKQEKMADSLAQFIHEANME